MSTETIPTPPRPKKRRRVTRRLELWLGRVFLRTVAGMVRLLPHRALYAVGSVIGAACYAAMPRYRRVALANLRRAFGSQWNERRIAAVARASFRHLGITIVEALWLARLGPGDVERLVQLEGAEHLAAALAGGHGAILVSAHYGNWEMMPMRLAAAGYRLNTIVRDADDPGVNELLSQLRQGAGQKLLPRSSAIRPALACLRRNEILAAMLDQNTLKGGIFVDFFGIPAATAPGPATFAARTGAPLVPIFGVRLPDRRHRVLICPPIVPRRGAEQAEEVQRLTAAVTQAIEQQIRACPEQWTWLHNRWKLRPDGSRLR